MSVLIERIEERLKATGLTARGASIKAGLHADAIRNIQRAGATTSPRGKTLQAIAQALECDVRYLLGETDDLGAPIGPAAEVQLPVRYSVGAGAWREVDDTDQTTRRMAPAQVIPGLENLPQWLEEVEGDSMDRLIPPGALVHVVDNFGYTPRHGDLVVVLRSRAGGHFQERTLKQVELTPTALELWPRSHNAKWSRPIILNGGAEDDEDMTVQIVGKVVRAYIGFGE